MRAVPEFHIEVIGESTNSASRAAEGFAASLTRSRTPIVVTTQPSTRYHALVGIDPCIVVPS